MNPSTYVLSFASLLHNTTHHMSSAASQPGVPILQPTTPLSTFSSQRQFSTSIAARTPPPPAHIIFPPPAADRSPTARTLSGSIQQLQQTSASSNSDSAADPNAATSHSSSAPPAHWSIFYTGGTELLPAVTMHYLHLGAWCTIAGGLDYFLHRQLKRGEVMGHRVHWLHTARPRDRFVFLIDPVEAQEPKSIWGLIWKTIYGKPPAFAIARGRLLWRISEESSVRVWQRGLANATQQQPPSSNHGTPSTGPKPPPIAPPGVEAIEVLHSDITAMDYAPGITSNRLALETKVAAALWFPTAEQAYEYYGCLDKNPANRGKRSHDASMRDTVRSFRQTNRSGGGGGGGGAPVVNSLTNASGLSDQHHRYRDGGEVIESFVALSRESTLSQDAHFQQPPSPHPSPSLDAVRNPTSIWGDIPQVDEDRDEASSGLPPALELPPSGAVVSDAPSSTSSSTRRRSSTTLLDVSALSAKQATPYGSPDLPHRSQNDSFDIDDRRAESAAAELLHSTATVQPTQTLKHYNTMVVVYTQDPSFNAVLRDVLMPEQGTFPYTASVQEQKRLLSMYEAGMPTWTIFFSRYGLPYRRWFRLVAVMLVNLWPLIALGVGLYDLYKHMPYLKEFLADTLTPLTGWMEHHFTLRISMLVTYLVTVSYSVLQALHSFGRSAIALTNFVFAPVLPVIQMFSLLKYPFLFVWTTITFVLGPVITLLSTLWLLFTTILAGPFRMMWYVFRTMGFVAGPSAAATTAVQQASYMVLWWRSWLDFWDKVARPIKNVAKACYDGIVHLGVSIARREASIRRWYFAKLSVITMLVELYVDVMRNNWLIFMSLPSWRGLGVSLIIVFWSVVVPCAVELWLINHRSSAGISLEELDALQCGVNEGIAAVSA